MPLPIVIFDSPEEHEFNEWCHEAGRLGIVAEFVYHPDPFRLSPRVSYRSTKQLKTRIKEVDAFLLHPHEYTPDFELKLSDRGRNFLVERKLLIWPPPGMPPNWETAPGTEGRKELASKMFIDVKPAFSRFHDAKQFSINQKWVFQDYAVYIYKAIPEKWFKATWVPQAALRSPKKGKVRDKYRGCRTMNEIESELNKEKT